MDNFCNSTLWDLDGRWKKSECLEQTVLVWVPCCFMWLLAPYEDHVIRSSKDRRIPWSLVNVTKTVVTSLLIVTAFTGIGIAIYEDSNGGRVADIYYVSQAILTVTFVLVLVLTLAGKRKGIRSSGSIFTFWSLVLVCGAFAFARHINSTYESIDEAERHQFIWDMIYFPLIVVMFFVNCFADVPAKHVEDQVHLNKASPEESASFLSKITFFWFDPLAWKAWRRPLTANDLYDLKRQDRYQAVIPRFDRHYVKAVAQQVRKQTQEAGSESKTSVSILPSLVKAFGVDFFGSALLQLVGILLAFVGPMMQGHLIGFVKNRIEETWRGYMYAFTLLVGSLLQTLVTNQYNKFVFVIGLQMKTSIISTIYRKSLRICNWARKETAIGNMVDLISVDTERVMGLVPYLNMLWYAPLEIGLCVYFLYKLIGAAVFSGLAVMIVLLVVNGFIATKLRKLQIEQMRNKDKRVKTISEILSGIKVLKFLAWESSFEKYAQSFRDKEIKALKSTTYFSAFTYFLWTFAPILVSLVSFMTFVFMGNDLTPETAFVSLTYFNMMKLPMTFLPMFIVSVVEANVSIKRMNKFLNADELDPETVSHDTSIESPISVEQGSFSWTKNGAPLLKNINMKIEFGQLVAIVGHVGSGKSSLVFALLGEMIRVSGRVNMNGTKAYVPQEAWIQNMDLRSNILFGKHFNQQLYDQVVDACALKGDLSKLPAGDQTEIGDRGMNLSGGQKQRISLARAVYSDKDVYLFDDPLSAVDSHVGKHIFEQVIGLHGLLKTKTRVLVTHGITYLPQVDQIIVMKDGQVSEVGTYRELLARRGAFAEFLLQHVEQKSDELSKDKEQFEMSVGAGELNRRPDSIDDDSRFSSNSDGNLQYMSHRKSPNLDLRERHHDNKMLSKPSDDNSATVLDGKEKLIESEKAATGKVDMAVYLYYFRAIGAALMISSVVIQIANQVLNTYSNVWLEQWSDNNTTDTAQRNYYLEIYAAFGFAQAFCIFFGSVSFSLSTLYASRVLHANLLQRIMRCPMSFFDSTPIGRIVNRFAKDIDAVDSLLPPLLKYGLSTILLVITTIIVLAMGSAIFIAFAIPLGILYFVLQQIYVATSRQLKRLESVSRSPIYSHFGETLAGTAVVRAYGDEERFIGESEVRVNTNQVCYYPGIIATRWLSVRLETIGNLVVLSISLWAVIGIDHVTPGSVGLTLSYALQITHTLSSLMQMSSEIETNIVSVERIREYSQAPQEASWDVGRRVVAEEWPEHGSVSFDGCSVRYREGLDFVLKGISCEIVAGEKVGIVGYTGAGKSSLTLALFRVFEATGGAIFIDGVNIADLGLHALRSRLTIIPQDPVLFSGSLRVNLDPFNNYTDDALWLALEHAHLKDFVKSLPSKLHHEVAEGGENLSVGQRQLVCLARALLRKTKVLILDEATAAVDLETDDLIQATIRKEFKECTVLTIAHRLNTIMDSDRVMVLDQGEMKEFAEPSQLLSDEKSIFYGMAKDAGLI